MCLYFDVYGFIRCGMRYLLYRQPHLKPSLGLSFPFNRSCWVANYPATSRTSFSSNGVCPSTLHHSSHHIYLQPNEILNLQAIA